MNEVKQIAEGIFLHTCNRCKYEWPSRTENPKTCAGCRSPYWNKKRVRK